VRGVGSRTPPQLVAARDFADADIAAVLHCQITTATGQRRTDSARHRQVPRLIAGLIPHPSGPMTDDLRQALDERQHLIEQRSQVLAETALADDEPWTRDLGEPPVKNDGEQSGCATLRRWPPIAIATTSPPTPRAASRRKGSPSASMRPAPPSPNAGLVR